MIYICSACLFAWSTCLQPIVSAPSHSKLADSELLSQAPHFTEAALGSAVRRMILMLHILFLCFFYSAALSMDFDCVQTTVRILWYTIAQLYAHYHHASPIVQISTIPH